MEWLSWKVFLQRRKKSLFRCGSTWSGKALGIKGPRFPDDILRAAENNREATDVPSQGVCLCSCREELADIPNGRQEEARRGCSAMPLRWVSYWLWLTGSLASLEPWITEMQSCAFLGAGHWPTSHGSFTSWDNFPLLSWHIPSRALWVMGHRAQMLTKWKASLLSSLSGIIRNWYMNFASLSSGLHPSSQRRGL